eukprot:4449249-Alexandrium_andersonii.AAC.1
MSASLVGSEMCIRDSPNTNAGLEDVKHGGVHGLDKSCRLGSLYAEAAHYRAPVSYTHLTLPTICSV